MKLTAYQRGNRDALINAAALLEHHVKAHEADAERWRLASDRPRCHVGDQLASLRFMEIAHQRAGENRHARDLLLRLAEQMPEDPEEVTE